MRPARLRPARLRAARLRAARSLVGIAVLAVAATLAACGSATAGGTETVRAVFSDAGDLVAGAPVQMADVQIGNVTGISLAGDRALVTMAIDRGARVPADVIASLTRTTILGEKVIQLRPVRSGGPLLRDGATIARTAVVPGVQQLVSAGAEVFGAVSASALAEIVNAGGQGFGGRSPALSQLLDSFAAVATGYAGRTADIRTLIANLDVLGSTMAPSSASDAQSLATLAQTTGILARESGRFESLLRALNDLSIQGRSLLESYFPQMTEQIHALAVVAAEVAARQQDLAGLLKWLPGHNAAVSAATVDNFVQILNDLIICGVPGGGSNPNEASATCAARPASGGGGGG